MPQGRTFKPFPVNKFKGLNTSLDGSVPEEYAQDDQELASLVNFNTTTDGFLEKRTGIYRLTPAISSPYVPTKLRVVFLQRSRVGNLLNRIFVTDGTNMWRMNSGGGGIDRLTMGGGGALSYIQAMVEYGGTTSTSAYNCTGVRWWPTQDATQMATGILGFYGDSTIDQSGPMTNTPIGTYIVLFKNRAFVINTMGKYNASGYETKVWFSNPGNLADFGGASMNNFNLDYGDGDYLTAMLSYNDQLLFFKTRKTYMVSADGPTNNWQYRLISDRIGCVGRGTVKVINDIIYFLSVDGVVRTDGTTFENISDPIRDLLDVYRDYYRPETAMNLFAGYWDYKYILFLPTNDSITNTALVFDVRTENWTTWKFAGGVTANGAVEFEEHFPNSLYFGSSTGGDVWQLGQQVFADNSVNYECSLKTKKYDFGSAMKRKRNHLVGVSIGDVSSFQPGTIVVNNSSEDAVVTTRTEIPQQGKALNVKSRGAGYGRYFQTEVKHNSGAYVALYDITFMNEERHFEPKSVPARNS